MSSKCTFSGCGKDLFKMGYCIEHWRAQRAPANNRQKLVAVKKTQISSTVTELMSSVKKQMNFGRMIEYSVECVSKMGVDETSVEEIIENGAIETLFEAVKKHPNNEKLHKMFMDMIAKFAMNERLAKMLADRLGNDFGFLTHSLLNHTDPSTHISTCNAILALAQYKPNLDAMARAGVIEALSRVISQYPNNLELLSAAAKCLTAFAEYKAEYGNRIMNSGGVENLLKAMAAHPEHLELSQAVTSLIAALANSSNDHARRLKEMGAVDIISASLEMHPYNEMLLEAAARALKALTGDNDMDFLLSRVGDYMMATVGNVALMSKISNLLLVEDNVRYMMKHKGIDWLISTLNRLAGQDDEISKKILASACRALQRAAIDENKIYKIIKEGGIKALLAVLIGNMKDPLVVAAALAAIAKFVSRPENAVYVAKSGVLQAAMKVGDMHALRAEVIRPLVEVLSSMSMFPETHEHMKDAGVIEQLLKILKNHDGDASIVTPVLNTLGRLMSSEDNVTRMIEEGLLPLLVKALNDHPDDLELCKAAFLAMETVSLMPSAVEELNNLKAMDAIQNVLQHQPFENDIQEIGGRVLHMLKNTDELKQAEELRREMERIQLEEAERLRRQEEADMARALEELRRQEELEEAERRRKEREERIRQEEERRRQEEEELKLKAYQAKLKAEQEHLKKLIAPKKVEPERLVLKKSARDIFKDDSLPKKEYEELNQSVKQFLQGGALLTKHSNVALPRKRHVYLSQDCKYLVWKEPGAKEIKPSCRMKVERIFAVETGRCTPQLKRLMPVTNKPMANEDIAFAIFGAESGTDSERTVDLEAATQFERDKWVEAIEVLIEWAKQNKLYGSSTMQISANEEMWSKADIKAMKLGH